MAKRNLSKTFPVLNVDLLFTPSSSFRSEYDGMARPTSWSDSPMSSSQAGQREYLVKHLLGKKEKEYVDIKTFK